MRLSTGEARRRFTEARVARLATAGADAVPHVVPVTFAVDGDAIVFAVDHKPKTTTALRRLRNIAANPAVSLLVDHYEDDWTRLWWARADGHAQVRTEDPPAVALLAAKYPAYAERPPEGPVVRVDVSRWSGWSAA
ncbi:TIGR03668 family PPOX class F420-dependent oxidoreductase [Haloechinothrix halophila]|uniref:TIGR03668 family PPOX class F420-dependent oxidoreductase n=1 Tax=Haloechinothrix halophila TaxID=1069073 RepID=UPI0004140329|nr:TIGR03668 family PPOX class F420-dependent oxidoreductase [Haloechinothrix halophila]